MIQRRGFQTLTLSAVVISAVCLLAGATSLTTQKPIDKREGAPAALAGIKITVVNKSIPNSTPKSVTTDKDGRFDLGVLPAGAYVMSFRLPANSSAASRNSGVLIKLGGADRSATPTLIKVTIEGTTEGAIVRGWDPKTKQTVDLTDTTSQIKGEERAKTDDKRSPQMGQAEPAAKTAPDVVFTADGKQRVTGATHDISMGSIRNMK